MTRHSVVRRSASKQERRLHNGGPYPASSAGNVSPSLIDLTTDAAGPARAAHVRAAAPGGGGGNHDRREKPSAITQAGGDTGTHADVRPHSPPPSRPEWRRRAANLAAGAADLDAHLADQLCGVPLPRVARLVRFCACARGAVSFPIRPRPLTIRQLSRDHPVMSAMQQPAQTPHESRK